MPDEGGSLVRVEHNSPAASMLIFQSMPRRIDRLRRSAVRKVRGWSGRMRGLVNEHKVCDVYRHYCANIVAHSCRVRIFEFVELTNRAAVGSGDRKEGWLLYVTPIHDILSFSNSIHYPFHSFAGSHVIEDLRFCHYRLICDVVILTSSKNWS